MYIPINPWAGIDPDDMPDLEVSDTGAKILKWVLAFLIILLVGVIVYAFCFMFK